MAKQLTITLPDKVVLALAAEGAALEESPTDVVKRFLVTAYTDRDGTWLNLRPVGDPELKDHPDLFLPSSQVPTLTQPQL